MTNGQQRMGGFTLYANNEIYIFSSYADPQTRINDLFVQQVDKKSLKLFCLVKEVKSNSLRY